MLSTLGKIFSRRYIEIFFLIFLIFPWKQILAFHADCPHWRQFVFMKWLCLFPGKKTILFSGKKTKPKKKKIIKLSSAELAKIVVNVKFMGRVQEKYNWAGLNQNQKNNILHLKLRLACTFAQSYKSRHSSCEQSTDQKETWSDCADLRAALSVRCSLASTKVFAYGVAVARLPSYNSLIWI